MPYMAPYVRGPILVVPIIRTRIYLGLFWGPLFMEAPSPLQRSLFFENKAGSSLGLDPSISEPDPLCGWWVEYVKP